MKKKISSEKSFNKISLARRPQLKGCFSVVLVLLWWCYGGGGVVGVVLWWYFGGSLWTLVVHCRLWLFTVNFGGSPWTLVHRRKKIHMKKFQNNLRGLKGSTAGVLKCFFLNSLKDHFIVFIYIIFLF